MASKAPKRESSGGIGQQEPVQGQAEVDEEQGEEDGTSTEELKAIREEWKNAIQGNILSLSKKYMLSHFHLLVIPVFDICPLICLTIPLMPASESILTFGIH